MAPADPVLPPEWDAWTARRAELIRKKNREGLSPEEAAEYGRLQEWSRRVVFTLFPSPLMSDDDRCLLEEMAARQQVDAVVRRIEQNDFPRLLLEQDHGYLPWSTFVQAQRVWRRRHWWQSLVSWLFGPEIGP